MTQGRRANRPRRGGGHAASLHQRWFTVVRFNFHDCCTTRAAVTKSLLDRSFSSRFESWRSEKIFNEDFHQDNFFVLVCGPSLLIENFSRSSETTPQCGGCCAGK